MNNTERYISTATQFHELRTELTTTYRNDIQNLDQFKGSEYYGRKYKELSETYREQREALQRKYSKEFDEIIESMRAEVEKRPMKPVTADQLNTLQALKLKGSVSEDEIARVKNLCADNPTAMSVLQEIARANHIGGNFETADISNEEALRYIDGLRAGTADFLAYDTTFVSRSIARRRNALGYGETDQNTLPLRTIGEGAEGVFNEVTSIPADRFNLFCEAVNGNR